MSYPLLMHHFKALEDLLRNMLNGFWWQWKADMLAKISLFEIFHCNVESLELLEPSQELNE